jgi:hypothetical protein
LSFLYALEWRAFAVLGVLGWFALINLEKDSEDDELARRAYETKMRADAQIARDAARADEDPALAAYNDHLARLASTPKRRLWGH